MAAQTDKIADYLTAGGSETSDHCTEQRIQDCRRCNCKCDSVGGQKDRCVCCKTGEKQADVS